MIYVVRHGQTDLNKEGRIQGRQGLPLNDHGFKQAESLRDILGNQTFHYVGIKAWKMLDISSKEYSAL
ncbi:histidine phosphatase family protein [Paenibacillus puerhi]|uniref:histidine phosphatase family protein n=1 Tax=Paenibacillus puerhi TaxID=2692622 RepID=UPI001F2BDC96|nr:histidine phosphatase family protein [Paenibacillus puerhi]